MGFGGVWRDLMGFGGGGAWEIWRELMVFSGGGVWWSSFLVPNLQNCSDLVGFGRVWGVRRDSMGFGGGVPVARDFRV